MNVIDIHIHGISGYDTRTMNEQDILKLAEIEVSCGVSEIIPTIYPDTAEIMRENILAVKKAIGLQESGVRNYATIRGVNLEGPFLNPQRCGALNAASFIEATEYNLKNLIDGFEDIVKIITIAPEIAGALNLIKQAADMGIVVSMGHSDATYSEAEAGFNAGAKGITHLFNAMSIFHHREPGLAGFGLLNKEIYTEVIADPYHLHPKTLELIFRIKNHEKIILISDTVKWTKMAINPPPLFRGGHGGAISDEKGKLQGGALTIIESSKRLIETGYDKAIVTACITTNPAMYLLPA